MSTNEKLEYWRSKNIAIATGKAEAKKDNEFVVLADKLVWYLQEKNQKTTVKKLLGFKNVSIKTNNEVAFGDKAIYNNDTEICKLFGNVKLQRGESFLLGEYAEVDLRSGISKLLPAPGKTPNENKVRAIQIIEFDDQQRVASSDNFLEGNLVNGQLLITDSKSQKIYDFPTSYFISNNNLENFSTHSLLAMKNFFLSEDDLQKIDSLIYSRLLMPLSIMAVIFLAGSMMFHTSRSSGVGRQIIIGISIGFIYDLIKDLSIASFLTYQLPIAIAYLLPITILLAIGAYKFQKI